MGQVEIELTPQEMTELDRLERALRAVGAQTATAEAAGQAAAALRQYQRQILINRGYDPDSVPVAVPDARGHRFYIETPE
jgi:hypothetical protein